MYWCQWLIDPKLYLSQRLTGICQGSLWGWPLVTSGKRKMPQISVTLEVAYHREPLIGTDSRQCIQDVCVHHATTYLSATQFWPPSSIILEVRWLSKVYGLKKIDFLEVFVL